MKDGFHCFFVIYNFKIKPNNKKEIYPQMCRSLCFCDVFAINQLVERSPTKSDKPFLIRFKINNLWLLGLPDDNQTFENGNHPSTV